MVQITCSFQVSIMNSGIDRLRGIILDILWQTSTSHSFCHNENVTNENVSHAISIQLVREENLTDAQTVFQTKTVLYQK